MEHDRHRGDELIWFPDPVGARECELVATGVELLAAGNPGVERVTMRLGVPATRRFTPPGRRDPAAGFGAVRAEVWGWRGTERATVVYGVIERTAVAAGTVLGVATAWLAGALPEVGEVSAGRVGARNRSGAAAVHRRVGAAGREGCGVRRRRGRLTVAQARRARVRASGVHASGIPSTR